MLKQPGALLLPLLLFLCLALSNIAAAGTIGLLLLLVLLAFGGQQQEQAGSLCRVPLLLVALLLPLELLL